VGFNSTKKKWKDYGGLSDFYIKTFSKPYLGQGLSPYEVQGRRTCRATPLIFHALKTPEVLPLHIIKASVEILSVVEDTLTMHKV
jgi:hypothetical protein